MLLFRKIWTLKCFFSSFLHFKNWYSNWTNFPVTLFYKNIFICYDRIISKFYNMTDLNIPLQIEDNMLLYLISCENIETFQDTTYDWGKVCKSFFKCSYIYQINKNLSCMFLITNKTSLRCCFEWKINGKVILLTLDCKSFSNKFVFILPLSKPFSGAKSNIIKIVIFYLNYTLFSYQVNYYIVIISDID